MGSVAEHMLPFEGMRSQVVVLKPREDLFANAALRAIETRALAYVRAGVPVHFRGPPGTGKTTLALQIAAHLGRPVVFLAGDGWLTTGDLIGKEVGVRSKQVVDNFIQSVKKVSSETTSIWADDVLTTAIEQGFTLVYDEFTRSPPKANNPLLMALEERMVIVPSRARADAYVRAHPEFRAIFTSNPEDYAGVSAPQDALLDRMITFDLDGHDRDTEVGIVAMRAGIAPEAAGPIVDVVRRMRARESGRSPSMRAAIMIARVAKAEGIPVTAEDPRFVTLCADVLDGRARRSDTARDAHDAMVKELQAVLTRSRPARGPAVIAPVVAPVPSSPVSLAEAEPRRAGSVS